MDNLEKQQLQVGFMAWRLGLLDERELASGLELAFNAEADIRGNC